MNILTEQEIIKAIQAGTELPDRDYKDDINLAGDKKSKAELAKDVIAIMSVTPNFSANSCTKTIPA